MIIDRNKLTPMMKQYFSVKDKYSDCILMYRLGDFYEMFFDDAIAASNVLDIALTGKNCGLEERAPMCGVPFHAVDSYIAKLVEEGLSVAVCEQTEDPSKAKGIVKRDVIRVVTPGTIMDTAALDAQKNNYLCSFCRDGKSIGLVFADITTGECYAGEYDGQSANSDVMDVLIRFAPTEIVMNMNAYEDTRLAETIKHRLGCFIRNYYDWAFSEDEAPKIVTDQFGQIPVGLDGIMLRALGGALWFLKETQKTDLPNIDLPEIITDSASMQIDMYSMRNLEITETIRSRKTKGSLLWVLNRTKTAMGGRLLRRMITAPLTNRIAIEKRHTAVSELVGNPMRREELIELFKNVTDMERLITKIVYKTANCHDLLSLKKAFAQLPQIKELMEQCGSKLIHEQLFDFSDLSELYGLIDEKISEDAPVSLRNGNMIKDGADPELDRLRGVLKNGRDWLRNLVEEEKEKTGIKTMKLGYNKVFGYYIEVSKAASQSVPDYFIRKQTLVNAERYITPKIKELEDDILNADATVNDMEYDMFCDVRDKVAERCGDIRKTAEVLALVDVLCSFASVAEARGYTKPVMTDSGKIAIKDGRHPVVEALGSAGSFIPNDAMLDEAENQVLIITGPNMAGKSTYMRQIAVIVLMAQIGSFVPASYAEIGVVDRIFTRVGASDDLTSGDSTFMVEMKEVAYILDNATKNSLIILDEIGRGTSTYDGLSIAWAVVEYIADKRKCGAKTLFATHYHELTQLEDKIDNVKNYCIAVKKKGSDITFLRKIIRGGADESYGVEVAALAGVKKSVLRRAKEIGAALESRGENTVGVPEIKTGAYNTRHGHGISEGQTDFFAAVDDPVLTELKGLDLNTMSPMQALNTLYDLQAKAKNS